MPKHDFKCPECTDIQCDVRVAIGEVPDCLVCGTPMEIFYGLWDENTYGLEDHGRSRSEKTDVNGFIKNWGCNDDPLTRVEILGGTIKDAGVRSFTADQQATFRGKLLRDGDSPQLRNEVLAVRRENLKAARAEYKKKAESK